MPNLVLKNLYKEYSNGFKAVKDVNIHIDEKEFLVLVGPSGCGKSTTLRMIAGLETLSSGEIYIGDKLVNDLDPKDRDIAMVFQNYALYPHMSVFDNLAFSLKMKKVPKNDIKDLVEKTAKKLELDTLLNRKPGQLSGGQRQRVALGRAIIRKPKLYLMDEPLSNLDAKLRVQMRSEIIKLYNEGEVQQIADPDTIYNHPSNLFVASFIGSPQMNFLDGQVIEKEAKVFVKIFDSLIEVNIEKANILKEKGYIGKQIKIGIRPEDLHFEDDFSLKNKENTISGKVELSEMLGHETYLYSNINGTTVINRVKPNIKPLNGDNVTLVIDKDKLHMFDVETSKNVL